MHASDSSHLLASNDRDLLADEHQVLLRHYGQVQSRCGELVRAQAAEIETLRAQAVRLRGAVIKGVTALAWAHESASGLSLSLAELVICQTGCLSHGAYWRVQDLCKRTGRTCVVVEQPDALHIVRIHKPPVREHEDG